MDTTVARFPIFIPSKSRHDVARTPRFLDEIGQPYRLVVEAHQADDYAAAFGDDRIVVLDDDLFDTYDHGDELGRTKPSGPGPARNMAWRVALAEGHAWHWVVDDNIRSFMRVHANRRIVIGDGTAFYAMEDFVLRYTNVAMAGPNYQTFVHARTARPPFITGTRIYSCNLIRNDVPFRWRGRYNEDTILSLDMLKAGWATVQFNAFVQEKMHTQLLHGGNTEAFYAAEGTLPKSQMLADAHPDVATVTERFGRVHHHVDYSRWAGMPLVRDTNWTPPPNNPYRFREIDRANPYQGTVRRIDRTGYAGRRSPDPPG